MTIFKISGSMYRGEDPKGKLSPISQENVNNFVDVQIDKFLIENVHIPRIEVDKNKSRPVKASFKLSSVSKGGRKVEEKIIAEEEWRVGMESQGLNLYNSGTKKLYLFTNEVNFLLLCKEV